MSALLPAHEKHILLLFVDGIGLGVDDDEHNPFSVAEMPTLTALTNGHRWLETTTRQTNERAVFVPTDPRLGVEGRPQSGSSQAVILTGQNVPEMLGRHYGPLPNAPIRELLDETNFFITARDNAADAALISAYPPQRLRGINSGKRLPSSVQYAAIASGQNLFTKEDVKQGYALTPEYTGYPWRDHLKIDDIPYYDPYTAGQKLVEISRQYHFAMHSHWMTDYVGHRGTLEQAVSLMETFDQVMAGVLDTWQDDEGLIIITSDHGNMEAMNHGKHTENDVPTLIIGNDAGEFAEGFAQLVDFVPRMTHYLFGD
ncbi:MAG: hypothetical protein AAFN11_16225 [Chloroflexota bacterium]